MEGKESIAPQCEAGKDALSPMTLADLMRAVGMEPVVPAHSCVVITDLTDDSRRVGPGSCFIAVRGAAFDGHDHIASAVRAGASVVIAERGEAIEPAVLVLVPDTRVMLAKLASAFFRLGGGTPILIGVTGTNGKTTTAWMIRSILRTAGIPCAMLGTVEYDLIGKKLDGGLTTPGAVALCRHLAEARGWGATHAALEVSSHALDQGRCDGLCFRAAVFTNLTGDHLDYHGSMEHYFQAKRRLFGLVDSRSFAVINADDSYGRRIAEGFRGQVITYSASGIGADIRAANSELDVRGSTFRLCGQGLGERVRLHQAGRHNIQNALAAAATALSLGVDFGTVQRGLESYEGAPGRLQRADPEGSSVSVLVDYAHTDDALEHVLASLRPVTQGRLICVFGCGGDRDRTKRPRMGRAVGRWADLAIVTSDNPRSEAPGAIIDEILLGFASQGSCRVISQEDRRTAIDLALHEARSGDTVLIAGKGHERFQHMGSRRIPFDDVAVARECLARRQ